MAHQAVAALNRVCLGFESGLCRGRVAAINLIWGALLSRHTAKWRSAVIKLANPSSNASRCVFLASPRYRTLA